MTMRTDSVAMAGDGPSPAARWLGLAGLLPFAAGAIALWTAPASRHAMVALALAAYGASIVAFLGGLHWGLAARGGQRSTQYAWGVVPSLLAWVALLLPARIGLAVLAATLVACYAVDRRVLPAQGLASWMPLRARLTAVAAASCLAGVFAL